MSNKKDALGDRMKAYEYITRSYLTRRVPVIIRLDGKAFHTFTRGMKKPFDDILTKTMQDTMKYLCENIQGCIVGYTQSDEITLVLTDYATIQTDAWFGYNIQKMTSIAASMATLAFNNAYRHNVNIMRDASNSVGYEKIKPYFDKQGYFKTGLFDARVFSIPKEEVCNCLIWRQQDATRNSIEAVGQAFFSQRELHKKSCNEIQEMLWSKHNINWNDFPTENKRGSCCIKEVKETEMEDPRNPGKMITVSRRKWVVDTEIPIFTQDRSYVEGKL